jgi:hypothetical protein
MTSENNYLDLIKKVFEKNSNKSNNQDSFYNPSLKDAKNSTNYISALRFVPYLKDPDKSCFKKNEYFIKDPITGSIKVLDAPGLLGEKNFLLFVCSMLKNKKNAYYEELSKKFYYNTRYFSPVQVIKDENKPEAEGKILWFSYKNTIYNKIENQMNGEDGITAPHNPFDIKDGKRFALIIKKRGDYPYYDESRFLEDKDGILINGNKVKEITKELIEFLQNNTPDFDLISPKKWGENEVKTALTYTKIMIGNEKDYRDIVEKFLKTTNISECSYYNVLVKNYEEMERGHVVANESIKVNNTPIKQNHSISESVDEAEEIEEISDDEIDKLIG